MVVCSLWDSMGQTCGTYARGAGSAFRFFPIDCELGNPREDGEEQSTDGDFPVVVISLHGRWLRFGNVEKLRMCYRILPRSSIVRSMIVGSKISRTNPSTPLPPTFNLVTQSAPSNLATIAGRKIEQKDDLRVNSSLATTISACWPCQKKFTRVDDFRMLAGSEKVYKN